MKLNDCLLFLIVVTLSVEESGEFELKSVRKSGKFELKCLHTSSEAILCQSQPHVNQQVDSVLIDCFAYHQIYQTRILWPRTVHSLVFRNCSTETVDRIVTQRSVSAFESLSLVSLVESENDAAFQCEDKLKHMSTLKVSRSESLAALGPLLSCPRVRHLDLSWNNLIDLDVQLLNNVTTLNKLDLSNNNIVQLSSQIFSKNNNLEFINLANNSINSLKKRVFKGKLFLYFNMMTNNIKLKKPS